MNILLDLDNTLISSLSTEEEQPCHKRRMKKYTWKDMDGYYKVFERPGLQDFLDFLFKHFNVSVWTAASKSYALFIINHFILDGHPERRLDYIFFSHHCRQSKRQMNSQKHLNMLWSVFNIDDYNEDNTFIIDDNSEVYSTQPNRCIHVKPFEFTAKNSHKDKELIESVIPSLKDML
jgi:TFIIF-interacting CTD phosphatase-like protein